MKRFSQTTLAVCLIAGASMFTVMSGAEAQQQQKMEPATVTGTSACAQCQGNIQGHDVMLFLNSEQGQQKQGMRIVLTGSGPDYKKAHQVRKDGKQMTAVIEGPIQAKTDKNGDLYLQAKAAQIKMGS